ncbi:hypothetical protein ACIOD2_07570 [Amycolatopsis sp. NPDC088138]|uniref:hypothetical protein n=1 Tax=Amycolatopsis sp. NPDC088138 TaxID=3363938 RepID=UPI0037FCD1A5
MNKKPAVVGMALLAVVAGCGNNDAPAAAPPPSAATGVAAEAVAIYPLPDEPGKTLHIPVPSTWSVTHDKERASYRKGGLLLETDRVPITQEDALSGLQAVANGQGAVAEHAPIAERDTAEWDFTYERDGVPRRVTVIGLGAGDALVTIRFEAPAADFERDRSVLDNALKIS